MSKHDIVGIAFSFTFSVAITSLAMSLVEQDQAVERSLGEDEAWFRAQHACAIANSVRAGPTPDGWMDQCMFRHLEDARTLQQKGPGHDD